MSRTQPVTPAPPAAFRPDYAVPPGDTLAEWLEENSMTQAELATRLNLSAKALNQIVRGRVPLSQETALRLEAVTGVPARTWNALEALYAEDRTRLARDQSLAGQVEFLLEMPVSALRKLGVVTRPGRDKVGTLSEVLAFFGVADTDAWRRLWQSPQAAFRKSQAFTSQAGAVAAWLRLGELEAAGRTTAPYDRTKLQAVLPQLRALTALPDPAMFQPEIERLCANSGVVVVFVEEVKGARCSGASRWIAGRPVVQLSLRFGTDDQMWFSLFHELARPPPWPRCSRHRRRRTGHRALRARGRGERRRSRPAHTRRVHGRADATAVARRHEPLRRPDRHLPGHRRRPAPAGESHRLQGRQRPQAPLLLPPIRLSGHSRSASVATAPRLKLLSGVARKVAQERAGLGSIDPVLAGAVEVRTLGRRC